MKLSSANPTDTSSRKSSSPGRSRWRLSWVAAVACLALAGVWAYYNHRYPNWEEEVRLSDGRVITIRQKREYFENYGTNQSWVEIDLPELGGKQVWHSYLMPQRIDVVDGRVIVFGKPRGPRQMAHYRYPKNYMVAFIWRDGDFKRIPFLEVPDPARREENVYPCIPAERGKLTMVRKDREWCPPTGDRRELGKRLDLAAYSKAADASAALSNWTDRSE